jgi:hypothetical protein
MLFEPVFSWVSTASAERGISVVRSGLTGEAKRLVGAGADRPVDGLAWKNRESARDTVRIAAVILSEGRPVRPMKHSARFSTPGEVEKSNHRSVDDAIRVAGP